MGIFAAIPLTFMADASAASSAMRSFVTPAVATIIGIASIAVVFFLINGGIQYMTSSGNPEKLEHAKKVIRNALIGLVMVIAAASLTAILAHAYSSSGSAGTEHLPALVNIEPSGDTGSWTDLLVKGVVGFLKTLIVSAGKPFLDALQYFTAATPLMADNSGVFNLWLAIVGITDVLFVLVIALLGFHVMSFASFGLEEIEFKHLLPQIGLIFLLVNTSIFAVDAVISLSNAMIHALSAGFPTESVWSSLTAVVDKQDGLGLAALLIMVVFLILTVILLVYYVLRLVTLYIGAVLSPIVFLLWLVPGFKDFAETAAKTYIGTIFVLFIHVVILQLAASIFSGMTLSSPDQQLNPVMSMIVGVATILALLKTQGVLTQLSYASAGPRTARKLGGQFVNAVSYFGGKKSRSAAADSNSDGTGSGQDTKRRGKSPVNVQQANYNSTTKRAPDYTNTTNKNSGIDYPSAAAKTSSKKSESSKKGTS